MFSRTSLEAVIQTATGVPDIVNSPSLGASFINEVLTGTPSWLGALPTPAQSAVRSIFQAEVSIINKDVSAAPGRVGASFAAMACAVAVGFVAIVLL